MISRRDFLLALGLSPLFGCSGQGPGGLPAGELFGPSLELGHRLRSGDFPVASETRRTGTLIIGGGVSGLSAAWWLARNAVDDFLVLEMEAEAGGNSRAGKSGDIAYPWGAHYLPLPGPEAVWVRELLAELNVLQGSTTARKPTYDENHLCATPHERVFRNGLWDEGLLPSRGVDVAEKRQQKRFSERMARYRISKGRDGRRIFELPMALSSHDPKWLALDRVSFRDWLLNNSFTAPSLHWLANYACRDDFGTSYDQTSAWAGLHYFACRDGEAANAESEVVLTRPEGNAWLVRGMAAPIGDRLIAKSLVWRIEEDKHQVAVNVLIEGKSVRFEADRLIWAAPMFALPRVWQGMPDKIREAAGAADYAPWLTANLHLSDFPEERRGAPPAWDNVLYDGVGLGYVTATHQLIRRQLSGTVLTYYRPLNSLSPGEGRKQLLETDHSTWTQAILDELSLVHPNIGALTTRLDVYRNGHAMRRPSVGSLFGGQREQLVDFRHPRIALAHADLSGFSLFEEAQYRGIAAARQFFPKKG